VSGVAYSAGSNKNYELGREGSTGGFERITKQITGSKTEDIQEVQTIEAGFCVSFFGIGGQLYSCGSTIMSL